jgi:YVTN family beta-propeller protein
MVIAIFLLASSSASATIVGPYAYIANYGDGRVSVIDTQTNTVTATIDVGGNPYGIAVTPDGSKVYVGKSYDSVAVIDTTTNTVTATIPINAPWGIAVSPDGSRVYIADEHEGIYVIDPLTDNVIATIPLDCSPMGIAVSSSGTAVYATSAVSDMIMVIDATTNTEVTSSPYVGEGPWGIVVMPVYDIIYTANNWDNTVSEIDTEYLFEHSVTPVGKWPTGIAMTPDGNRLYVANSGDRTVTSINIGYVEDPATIQVGLNPTGISMTPDGSEVYVTNSGSDTVSVIDTATNTETAIIRVEDTPISFGQFIGPALEVPTADFYENRTTGVAPMGVQFTDASSDDTKSWQWDFGDGTTSTEQNPAHVYATAGTYDVTLKATNRSGTDTKQKPGLITVIAQTMPAAGFDANRTKGLAPLGIQFTDESTGYTTGWAWDFGDVSFGTSNATIADPVHYYSKAGIYNVTLTAINSNGTSTLKKVSMITVITPTTPVAGFTANRTAGTAPLGIQFTDGSTGYATAWAWNFGDGTANSTEQNPIHIYASPGTYNVVLTAINDNGTNTIQKTGYISASAKTYPTPVTISMIGLYSPATITSTPLPSLTPTPTSASITPTATPSSTVTTTATPTTGSSSSSLAAWIILLAIVVLAIGAATYYFVIRK